MQRSTSLLFLAALLVGGLVLSSCGGSENGTSTSTSALDTESGVSKTSGMADSTGAPTSGTGIASPNDTERSTC
jgi:hypothetical protein